jgi:serine/threonine-protein kinase
MFPDDLNLETGEKWGKYVILERTDRSDIHISYCAVDPVLEKHVLIKIFHGHYSSRADLVSFRDLARKLMELKHKHIVAFHDVAEEQGYFYVVIDYIRGYTLQDWLLDNRTYDQHQTKTLALTAIDALEFASQKNALHLYIKPIRFVIDWDNQVRISNIGLVQCHNLLTGLRLYDPLANPLYVSPEQISGLEVSIQTDMYSLGATLFHLLTGHPVYQASTNDQICRAHLIASFPEEYVLSCGLDPEWANLLERLLQKKPADRFGSYAEFRKSVQELPD